MIKVMVAGYFDPLHQGHLEHMIEAAKLGDYLVVVVANDEQIIKKYGYVLSPLGERIFRIMHKIRRDTWGKGLGIIVSEDTDKLVCKTLKSLKPDIYAKGGDRTLDNMPLEEIKVCEEIGCKIVYGIQGKIKSSTKIRQRIERFRNGESCYIRDRRRLSSVN